MHLVMSKVGDHWIRLDGAIGKLLTTVKAGIRPASRRRWNHEHSTWEIHWPWVHSVAGWARGQGYTVDWSSLPDTWQMAAAGASVGAASMSGGVSQPNAFEALYVEENAPDEVVTAAFRALAKKHHPDRGGDEEEFKKISDAYEAIRNFRGVKT